MRGLANRMPWTLRRSRTPRQGCLTGLGAKNSALYITEGLDLRPTVALFAKCHELFSDERFGEMAGGRWLARLPLIPCEGPVRRLL